MFGTGHPNTPHPLLKHFEFIFRINTSLNIAAIDAFIIGEI